MQAGLFFAALTSLLFGSWAVPVKTLQIESKAQTFWLTVGHLAFAATIFVLKGSPLPLSATISPFVAGIIWGLGMFAAFAAIKEIGITRAVGIWVPTIILTSALWGLFYFGELWTLERHRLFLTGIAILFVLVAATFVILSNEDVQHLQHVKMGVVCALALGICHGSYFVPLRASAYSIFTTFVPLSVGMVVVTLCVAVATKVKLLYDRVSLCRMMATGIILCSGNYTALFTLERLGVSLGYPLTQLGIVVNTLWGMFLFKEVATKRGYLLVSIGVAITLAGAILLNCARCVR